jgi:hypothetical protein
MVYLSHKPRKGPNRKAHIMATTHRITSTIKVAEFPELYAAFSTMTREDNSYWNVLALVYKQTEAKQAKWWAYYDARQAEKAGA